MRKIGCTAEASMCTLEHRGRGDIALLLAEDAHNPGVLGNLHRAVLEVRMDPVVSQSRSQSFLADAHLQSVQVQSGLCECSMCKEVFTLQREAV